MESPDKEAGLKAMKYRDVQKVAKEVGVKGTLTKDAMVQKILEVKTSRLSDIMASGM